MDRTQKLKVAERLTLVLSCEHAGNQVPTQYKKLFMNRERILKSHRGYDPGAYSIAKPLSQKLKTKLVSCKTTRLLVDVNRTLNQESLFSTITNRLEDLTKKQILLKHYLPYRKQIQKAVMKPLKKGYVLHFSIHSFTPIFKGKKRSVDIGVLFHSQDKEAALYSKSLKSFFEAKFPKYKIELNQPYQADDGGIMESLKEDMSRSELIRYHGIYLEVNQRLAKNPSHASKIASALFDYFMQMSKH